MVFGMEVLRLGNFGTARMKYVRCLQEEMPGEKIALDDSMRGKRAFEKLMALLMSGVNVGGVGGQEFPEHGSLGKLFYL
jgi:hypothetical protein